jgi:hypothetical protein
MVPGPEDWRELQLRRLSGHELDNENIRKLKTLLRVYRFSMTNNSFVSADFVAQRKRVITADSFIAASELHTYIR